MTPPAPSTHDRILRDLLVGRAAALKQQPCLEDLRSELQSIDSALALYHRGLFPLLTKSQVRDLMVAAQTIMWILGEDVNPPTMYLLWGTEEPRLD